MFLSSAFDSVGEIIKLGKMFWERGGHTHSTYTQIQIFVSCITLV